MKNKDLDAFTLLEVQVLAAAFAVVIILAACLTINKSGAGARREVSHLSYNYHLLDTASYKKLNLTPNQKMAVLKADLKMREKMVAHFLETRFEENDLASAGVYREAKNDFQESIETLLTAEQKQK